MQRLLRAATTLALVALATAVLAAPAGKPAEGATHAPDVGMRPFKGDFDAIAKRRLVRVLVPFSKTFYYIERGRPRGVSADIVEALQADLNRTLKTPKSLPIRVVALPVARDELVSRLIDGYGDVVIADLTITPARQEIADFAAPMFRGVREVVVTAPGQPPLASADDLAGRSVFVRRDTSYWEHLEAFNRTLVAAGKPPVKLVEAPPELEGEDSSRWSTWGSSRRPSSTATRRRCGSRCSASTRSTPPLP